MEQDRKTIVVDDSLSPEGVMEKAASYFRAGISVVEIDLSKSVPADKCQEILDYLEAAFGFKRKKIALRIASSSLRELTPMIRHSDVITEVVINTAGSEMAKTLGLIALLKAQIFASTHVRYESA